jgi:hypothetical protein
MLDDVFHRDDSIKNANVYFVINCQTVRKDLETSYFRRDDACCPSTVL